MFMSLESDPQCQLWKIMLHATLLHIHCCCCHKNLFRIKKSSFVLCAWARETNEKSATEKKQSRKKSELNARIFPNVWSIKKRNGIRSWGSDSLRKSHYSFSRVFNSFTMKLARALKATSVMTRRDFPFSPAQLYFFFRGNFSHKWLRNIRAGSLTLTLEQRSLQSTIKFSAIKFPPISHLTFYVRLHAL